MKLKQVTIYLVLSLIILTTGCVLLRLLEVKRQLNDFNNYFQINDQNGFSLVFLNPTLHTDDILWLAKRPPTSKEVKDQVEGGHIYLKRIIEVKRMKKGN